MEKKELQEIERLWKEKGKELTMPKILVSKDKEDKYYYNIEDNSTIIFMVLKNSNITYSIPKKYLKKEAGIYKILDTNKLIPVSCPSKNKYELFVQNNLLTL